MPRALSFQATYGCQRSGACCTSNWPIPVEADRLSRLQAAVASGTLRTPGGHSLNWLRPRTHSPSEASALLAVDDGRCVFFDATGSHQCAIQSALGHDTLPLACRQFPRVSVHDPRGTSVVLSCYCPTAAGLLDAPGLVTIVESAPAFPANGEYVGLETRDGWPPILRSGVLMDWPSWWMFEARAVHLIANVASSADDAMRRLARVVADVRAWGPGHASLESTVAGAFAAAEQLPSDDAPLDARRRHGVIASLHAAIPREWNVEMEPKQPTDEPPTRHLRFLTCHAFANWAVHLGPDLQTWLDSLMAAHALVSAGFGVREADLWLRHLIPAAGLRDAAS